MDTEPKFEEYSYATLVDISGYIDGSKYPNRKKEVERLLNERKSSSEAIAFKLDQKNYLASIRYSTFLPRVIAGIIDFLTLVVLTNLTSFLFASSSTNDNPLVEAINIVLIFSYPILMHGYFGQTIGKFFLSLHVVQNTNETSICMKQAFIRDSIPIYFWLTPVIILNIIPSSDSLLLLVLLGFPVVGIIWATLEILSMLLNKKRRSIQDLIAGTVVIKAN